MMTAPTDIVLTAPTVVPAQGLPRASETLGVSIAHLSGGATPHSPMQTHEALWVTVQG